MRLWITVQPPSVGRENTVTWGYHLQEHPAKPCGTLHGLTCRHVAVDFEGLRSCGLHLENATALLPSQEELVATLWELCRGRKQQLRRWPQTPLPQQVAPTTALALAALATSPASCAQQWLRLRTRAGDTAPNFSICKRCDPTSFLLFKQSSLGFHPRQKPGFGPGWSDLGWRAGLPIEEGQRSFPALSTPAGGSSPFGVGQRQGQASPIPHEAEAGSRGLRGRKKDRVLTSGRCLSIQHMTFFSQ